MSGILVGSAVAGATALGVRQIEYNAQALEQASNAILQQNTVYPQRMVHGNLILKDCCDQFSSPNDTVRFEVTVNGKMSIFEFIRTDGKAAVRPMPVPTYAPVVAAASITTTQPQSSSGATVPPPPPGQPPPPPPSQESATLIPTSVIKSAVVVPAVNGTLANNRITSVGQLSYEAGDLAKKLACNKYPVPVMNAKGAGFETYTVSCANGDVLTLRCESGQSCRALQ